MLNEKHVMMNFHCETPNFHPGFQYDSDFGYEVRKRRSRRNISLVIHAVLLRASFFKSVNVYALRSGILCSMSKVSQKMQQFAVSTKLVTLCGFNYK